MDKLGIALAGLILFGATLLLGCLLGATVGALGGWVVGWTAFGTWTLHVLDAFGARGFTMAELGAACGFIGGFLKTSVEHKK
jgi:hypothetical protein